MAHLPFPIPKHQVERDFIAALFKFLALGCEGVKYFTPVYVMYLEIDFSPPPNCLK